MLNNDIALNIKKSAPVPSSPRIKSNLLLFPHGFTFCLFSNILVKIKLKRALAKISSATGIRPSSFFTHTLIKLNAIALAIRALYPSKRIFSFSTFLFQIIGFFAISGQSQES